MLILRYFIIIFSVHIIGSSVSADWLLWFRRRMGKEGEPSEPEREAAG